MLGAARKWRPARTRTWQIPRHGPLARVSLRRGQAVVHLLGIVGSGALFFFLLMNWQACNLQHPCRVACNPVPRSLQPDAGPSASHCDGWLALASACPALPSGLVWQANCAPWGFW